MADHPCPRLRSPGDAPVTSMAQLLDLLQVVDRSFPTGGFVHSHGLEWLLRHRAVDLEPALHLRLNGQLAPFELVFLVSVWHAEPAALDARYHAMLLPRESREASARVGQQFLRAARDLFPGDVLDAASALRHAHAPIAFGMVGQALGLAPYAAATVYAFQTIRAQISAAQRLTRLGQVEAQRLLHRMKPAIVRAADAALRTPLERAAPFAPLLDVASMAHERLPVRLFVS